MLMDVVKTRGKLFLSTTSKRSDEAIRMLVEDPELEPLRRAFAPLDLLVVLYVKQFTKRNQNPQGTSLHGDRQPYPSAKDVCLDVLAVQPLDALAQIASEFEMYHL
jgi:hypothetical protein